VKRLAAIAVLLSCGPSAHQLRLDRLEADVACNDRVVKATFAAADRSLDRANVALKRLEHLQVAARKMDEAEAAVQAARTSAERRAAWRAWQDARADLRSASR
jgi:hypothetical protein